MSLRTATRAGASFRERYARGREARWSQSRGLRRPPVLAFAAEPLLRFDYATAIADSSKSQNLLNVVKLRYADWPVFLELNNVVTGYNWEVAKGGRPDDSHPDRHATGHAFAFSPPRSPIAAHEWTHVAVTWSNPRNQLPREDTVQIYVNGRILPGSRGAVLLGMEQLILPELGHFAAEAVKTR